MSKNRYDDYDDYDFEETPSRRRSRNSGRRKKKEKKAKVVKEKVKATKDKPNKPKKKRTLKAKFFMILAAVLGLYCVAVLGYFTPENCAREGSDYNSFYVFGQRIGVRIAITGIV